MPAMRLMAVAAMLLPSHALAGVVLFDPPHQDVHQGALASFTITLVAEQLPDIQGVDLALRPSAGVPVTFVYSDEAKELFTVIAHCTPCDFGPVGTYGVGANNLSGGVGRTSFILGTLTVDTGDLPHDPETLHSILAGGLADPIPGLSQLLLSVGQWPHRQLLGEPLSGVATFRVTPEPGTGIAAMLALLAFAAPRPRRAKGTLS